MKAVVTITLEPVNDEAGNFVGMKPSLSGKWSDGAGPREALSAVQIVSILQSALNMVLANVPLEPPTTVQAAPASALKLLDAAGRPN